MGSAMCTLFRHKPVKVLYFGLDAAGKTTLLYRMKLGEVVTTIPTIGFNVETVKHKGVQIITFDVGTRDKSRPLIRHFLADMDALVFVVDSTDHERLEEAVDDFFKYGISYLDPLKRVPVLVLANKQDLAGAITSDELRKTISSIQNLALDWEVFPTTALTLEGMDPAMDWLVSKLAVNLAQNSYLPAMMSSAALSKAMHYPSYFLKSSYLKIAGLFASDSTENEPVNVTGEKKQTVH